MKIIHKLLLIATCVCSLASVAEAARFAVLVGNSNGGSDVSELRYVKNDLASLSTILKEFCGFDGDHMILLQDKSPAELEGALADLKKKLPLSEDNLLLFYYTGHADQEYLKMGNSRYPLQSLKESFSSFPVAIRIGVFDACQSGSFTRLKGGSLSDPFLFKEDSKIKGQVILSSSSATENAQESDVLRNSVFTFHIVNALRGSADMSGDRKVTLSEAYQYAYNHTVSSTASTWGGTQHPGYQFQIQGEGDIVLADLNMRSLGILLKSGVSGDITIEDEKGNVVADLDKERMATIMIALDPGTYMIYKNENGSMWRSKANVSSTIVPLEANDFEKTTMLHSRKKGAAQRYTNLKFGISGGVRRMVMKDLDKQTLERFSPYSMFGINPQCNFRYETYSAGVLFEYAQNENYLFVLSYERSKWKEHHSYTGRSVIDENKSSGGVSLQFDRTFEMGTFDIGTGYRWSKGVLKGFAGNIGFSFIGATYNISSRFADSLFDVTEERDFKDDGVKLLPFAAISYLYQITPMLAVGTQARFRYQGKSKSFTEIASGDPYYYDYKRNVLDDKDLKYNFRSAELHLNLIVTFRLKEVEE
jgi:hypothetical protein